ncbi:MAG TPA: hypothetical protein VFC19_51325 [Candidatus Limnocylindrales bacterium]|nr:hypothetical protein [Candidatus Limnocylindrales bacterium]
MSNDSELESELEQIRASLPYRISRVGLRLLLLSVAMVVPLVILGTSGAPISIVKVILILLFLSVLCGVVLTWLGGISLASRTSRYLGLSSGQMPDLHRSGKILRMVLADTLRWRHW